MKKNVVAELNHQINSPLAAIRNALYLAGTRTDDPEIQRYLNLADGEVVQIAETLKAAREREESEQRWEVVLVRGKAA